MEHYVTIFDSLFLPQGLALHASMVRCLPPFCLWVVCVDDCAFEMLKKLDLPSCKPLKLSELETESLRSIKDGRTQGEYCWTLTPFAPKFVFDADASVKRVTYLDADLWFRKSPEPIFQEFNDSNADVLITDHGYAPEEDQTETSGQYCVQFMTFNRGGGDHVRQWWEDRCIEWCFARLENGKFGDQKYLDDWPSRFGSQVHVLSQQKFAQGPWNANCYPYSWGIFYHFHGLRIISNNRVDCGIYSLPKPLMANVYVPYVKDIRNAIDILKTHGFKLRPQVGWLGRVKSLKLVKIMLTLKRSFFHVISSLWQANMLKF